MFDSAIPTQPQIQISEDIFPSDAHELFANNKDRRELIILDVCTPKEFAQLHLENALNLNLMSRAFKDQLNDLDKNKTYFVYCKGGVRSKMAQKLMRKLGFREVYNIIGGTFLWADEGLPFASGFESAPKPSFCPIFFSLTLIKNIKQFFQTGCRSLVNTTSKAGLLGNGNFIKRGCCS
jgi:rhodanese-related sulfurtransferase